MSNSDIDLPRARLLVGEISANLAALSADSARHAELRAEVDALKALLERADAQPALVEDRMKSIHGMVDRAATELQADGIRAGIFVREIGRMIGLD